MIKVVRYAVEHQTVSLSRWMTYSLLITQAIAYVSLYFFISNYLETKKYNFVYLLPCFFYIPSTILTTDRAALLNLTVYIAVDFSILYLKKEKYSSLAKNKILLFCIVSMFAFLSAFLIYGNFTGKTVSATRTPFVIFSHYVGLSIPALEKFIETSPIEDIYIGHNTLTGIYGPIISLGADFPKTAAFLDFVMFNEIDTNVYTAFRRYIEDYGITGMICLLFFFGIMTTFIYEYIKYKTNNTFLLIMYSSYVWTIVLSFHEEKFLINLINTRVIYSSVLTYLVLELYRASGCVRNSRQCTK